MRIPARQPRGINQYGQTTRCVRLSLRCDDDLCRPPADRDSAFKQGAWCLVAYVSNRRSHREWTRCWKHDLERARKISQSSAMAPLTLSWREKAMLVEDVHLCSDPFRIEETRYYTPADQTQLRDTKIWIDTEEPPSTNGEWCRVQLE